MRLTIKKVLAIILCITLLSISVGFAMDEQGNRANKRQKSHHSLPRKVVSNTALTASTIEKQETVFVNLNPDGSTRQIIDSNWLKNSQASSQVIDQTRLTDIAPISIAEYHTNDAGQIVWQTNGEDVYYQGETDKALPLDINIEYRLDDKLISPEQLAGKSGHVSIALSFENNSKQRCSIDGQDEMIATPFTAVAMVGLSNDTFSNITLQNGEIFSDGNNQIATFIGFPGLSDSLRLKESAISNIATIELPKHFVIEADVIDFSLSTIAIAITPDIPDTIKEISNQADIERDLADIDVLLNAKDTLERVDPTERLKALLVNPQQTAQARLLLADLFEFYDMETSLIEELPAYITDDNIQSFDRLKQHLEDYHFKAVLDNEVIKDLPNRVTADDIATIKKLLDRYDEIQTFDIDRLDSMDGLIDNRAELRKIFDQATDLLDTVDDHEEDIETLKTLSSYSNQISQFASRVEDSNLVGALSQSDMACMLEALAEKKATEATQQFMTMVPESGNLSPEAQQTLSGLVDQAIMAGEINATSGGAIKAVIASGTLPAPLRASIVSMARRNITAQVQQQISGITGGAITLISDAVAIKSDLQADLGPDYRQKITSAVSFARDLQDEMSELQDSESAAHDKLQAARNVMYNEEDISYFLDWKDKLSDMKEDLDANDANVTVLKDLLTQYDDPQIKSFYDNMHIIIDDMEEVRPIAESFKALLEKPNYDRQWHALPTTLDTLLDTKQHLENNKYLANTLALGLDDEVVNAMRDVIATVDKEENEGRLEEIASDLEQLKLLDERKTALIDLSENYTNFMGKPADMPSQVRFVMKTDPIEKPREKQTYQAPQKAEPSFFEWLAGLFSF